MVRALHLQELARVPAPPADDRAARAPGPGENAGAVDIGDGLAAVFKIESHNHPSFIEPYQGAATGVGGILRDVFTMGARPIANLNSLRFGASTHPRTPYLVRGVVAGIGGYGNCIGVPTVGGDVYFDAGYDRNILVNAFTLGIVRHDRIFRAAATGVGNPVIYVGSRTGRDGIHGASLLASAEFDDTTEEKRPTVQVGDPFTEKLLLEACLELMGGDHVVAIQDMGAAGLTSSSVEMAGRGGSASCSTSTRAAPRRGHDAVRDPALRVAGAHAARRQGRARGRREARLRELGSRGGGDRPGHRRRALPRALHGGEVVVDIPAATVSNDAPVYRRPAEEPKGLDELQRLDLAALEPPADLGERCSRCSRAPNLCSRQWI